MRRLTRFAIPSIALLLLVVACRRAPSEISSDWNFDEYVPTWFKDRAALEQFDAEVERAEVFFISHEGREVAVVRSTAPTSGVTSVSVLMFSKEEQGWYRFFTRENCSYSVKVEGDGANIVCHSPEAKIVYATIPWSSI